MSDPAPPHAPAPAPPHGLVSAQAATSAAPAATASQAAPPAPPAPPARASRAAWMVLLLVTALALAIDLGSKHLAFARIADAPVILDRYANTSSAGSVIAFHLHRDDLVAGDLGGLCSFGAGYSIGSLVLRKR